ncbi:MAG: AEC family transporter [Clostridia bacterium]|nr:AEC family transporter [Clostridia bacterium]
MSFFGNFYTVFIQVLILFVFMGFGFVGEKRKFISQEGSKVISDIILNFVTPCLIINSLNIDFDKTKFKGLIICFIAFLLIQAVSAVVAFFLFKSDTDSTNRVMRFALVFSNVGYMGIPLQKAVLGDEGVFYGSVCVAVFNIFMWTFGIICMSGEKKQMSVRKLFLNPGIVAVTIGLILFLFSIKLPTSVSSAISGMAALNTPLAMMVIGFNLARSNILSALKDKRVYIISFLRLVVIPLISLFVLLAIGLRGTILVSLIIATSAPVAAATTVLSVKFEKDTELSVKLVAFSTLLSIITMSGVVALAQMF